MSRHLFVLAGVICAVMFSGQVQQALADYPRTGWYADLHTYSHNVSGTVRIIDANTIRVTNFSYDGGGRELPGVFFMLAADDSRVSLLAGQRVGNSMWGTVYSHIDFGFLNVPGGLDGYNAVGVCCLGCQSRYGAAAFVAPEPCSAALLLGSAMPILLRRRR